MDTQKCPLLLNLPHEIITSFYFLRLNTTDHGEQSSTAVAETTSNYEPVPASRNGFKKDWCFDLSLLKLEDNIYGRENVKKKMLAKKERKTKKQKKTEAAN